MPNSSIRQIRVKTYAKQMPNNVPLATAAGSILHLLQLGGYDEFVCKIEWSAALDANSTCLWEYHVF